MRVDHISRIKKERFLKSLSEDDFRDQVVRPLLLRTGYSDGRDLCGPNEAGKDALFGNKDPLGFLVLTAVQTKKGNLNLASSASGNLVVAITQLTTALKTPVVLLKPKKRAKPNNAMLCASGTINDAARGHIIDEVRNPNIQFLDANDLIPLIDEHLPEFWLGIDADIQPYFRAIRVMVDGSPIEGKGPSFQSDVLSGGATDESFISLRLIKQIIRKKRESGTVHQIPDFVEIHLGALISEKSNRLLVLGDAGSGKSTGLLRLAYEIAREGLEQPGAYKVPILCRAADILRQQSEDLLTYLDSFTREVSGSTKACFNVSDLSDGRVVVLIDSLDELTSNADRSRVLLLIENLQSVYPKTKVIIGSRPYMFVRELPELRGYDEYRLTPISWRQAEKIITRVQKGKSLPIATSKEVLRKLERIHGIELNPLLITVFAASSDMSKQDIPANITELFKKFTELMLGRWDERKGLKYQYQAPLKDFVVTQVAFEMHSRKITALSKDEIERVVTDVLKARGYGAEGPALLSEILDRSGLFKFVGNDIEFRHHLLQEFFAGRGIPSPDFVISVVKDEWWKRPLVFYFGENPARADLLKSAMNNLVGAKGGDLFEAATTIGLANQACYLSTVSEKLDVWKWVVQAICIAREAVLEDMDSQGRIPLTAFAGMYLYARDSVALSNLRSSVSELDAWARNQELSGVSSDELLFWLITGLIEYGDVSEAADILGKFNPRDPRLLVAIHLGCHLAAHVRPLDSNQKGIARDVCKRFDRKVTPYREQLIKEWGSALVELRSGEIANADDDQDSNLA